MKNISLSGKVRRNLGRGRELGFPTANLNLHKDISEGIYAGEVNVGTRKEMPALVFIGAARTFGETQRKAEIHLLSFRGNLYGKKLQAVLLKKLRGNKKFASSAALVRQMNKDLRDAKKFFKEQERKRK